jgi:hypothetical protein
MSLIARFVFDKGDPVDVRLNADQKDEFLEDIREGRFFHDTHGEGVFYANLEHARFFYISKESTNPPAEVEDNSEEEVEAEA